jgi:hypothetical protein
MRIKRNTKKSAVLYAFIFVPLLSLKIISKFIHTVTLAEVRVQPSLDWDCGFHRNDAQGYSELFEIVSQSF